MRFRLLLKDMTVLTLVLGALFFILLGSRPLFVPDEGRYAEIAREMISSKEYLIPHLNGILYFEKPILFYWLSSLAFKIGGVKIWAIRSVNALLALLGCLFTYLTGYQLYDRKTGLTAALVLGTSLLYFIMAHMVALDLALTVFLAGSLYAFLVGALMPLSYRRRLCFYASGVSAALAVLTKGLVGILFPCLIIGAWLLLRRMAKPTPMQDHRFRLSSFYLPTTLLIFLLIALPWHVIVQHQHPEFFHFYFIEQHILRYTDSSIGHDEPIWFFIPCLLVGFLPWTWFLPKAFYQKQSEVSLFFTLWVIIVFLFFSFSKSKLIPYILPLYPALALLVAPIVARLSLRTMSILMTATGIALLGLVVYLPRLDTRTILPLATVLNAHLKPQDEVITYNQYYQDLPFYLGRRVSILNWKNELSFGMSQQDTHDWMIKDKSFWNKWISKRQVYVVMSQSEYRVFRENHPKAPAFVLAQTQTNLLMTNHPPKHPAP